MLKLCIFDLLLASYRLHLLAKAPKHAQIHLLRQIDDFTVFAPATLLPYSRTHKQADAQQW